MLNGFGVVVNSLGVRVKPYLPQICGTILWRLNNKAAKVRQQAADLISRISSVMNECNEVRTRTAEKSFVSFVYIVCKCIQFGCIRCCLCCLGIRVVAFRVGSQPYLHVYNSLLLIDVAL